MKKTIILIILGIMLMSLLIGPASVAAADQITAQAMTISRQTFHDQMRKLWEDHVWWTRVVIIDVFSSANQSETDAAVARLLQNQVDIGNAIKPFYGDAAGNQLTQLLRTHILQAADILADVKTGNTTELAADQALWYANAHDIAVFLYAANPNNWSLPTLDAMMKTHLDLTTEEALANFQHRWADDVAAFDAVNNEILMMADVLSNGIIAQFPNMFNFGFKSQFLELLFRLFGG